MKITRETFKNIVREVMTEESEYQEFFKRALEKTGKSIPDMSDEEKKAFFNKIDAAWQGKGEKNEELVGNQAKLDVDGDGEIEASDLAALRAGKKVNEDVNFRDGKYRFYSKQGVGYLTYDGKVLSDGDYDFEGGNAYWMSHSSWKGQKAFDTGKDVIAYFKKNKITTESTNEASKPTIKVVNKLKNEQGIQIVVVKTTKGETEYGGFVVRGKLQKVIPVGANKTKEDVKKRALQIWDEFGKQLGEKVDEAANLKTIAMLFQNKGIKDAVRKDHADKLRKIIEDSGVSTKGVSDSELIKVVKQLTNESVNEGKLGDTWRKNNKKGYVLKVGNIELKSAGPSNSHDILINRQPWGTFMMDYEAGGDDWWVKPMRGNDFWVDSIDDLVKRIKKDSRFKESVSEAKYPTDLKIGSVIMGQGFTRLKGVDGGKYYKVVAMDDTTATLVPSDKSGNVKGSSKVRHKLDSIEGGIKTAKRGDENGIVVIKESVNEAGGTVKNPKTGKDIKISTALSYGKSHPAYKAAAAASQQARPVGGAPGVKPKPPVNAKPAMGTKVTSPAPTNAKPAMGTKVTSTPPRNAQPPVGTKVTGPPPGVRPKPPVVAPPTSGKPSVGTPPGVRPKPPVIKPSAAPTGGGKPPLGPPPGVKAKPPVIAPPSATKAPLGPPPGVRPKGAVPPPPPPPPPSGKPAGTPPGVRPKGAVPPPPPPPPPVPPKKSKFEDKESVKEKKKIKK